MSRTNRNKKYKDSGNKYWKYMIQHTNRQRLKNHILKERFEMLFYYGKTKLCIDKNTAYNPLYR